MSATESGMTAPSVGRRRRPWVNSILRGLARPFTHQRSRRALASLVVGFLLWEASVHVFDISALIFSPPSAIARRFVTLVDDGTLQKNLSVSMTQFSLGYFGCAFVAIPLGLAIGKSAWLRDVLDPWISALYATPSISLAPLFIIWLGFGTTSKAFIVGLLSFFPILINTTAGVDSVAQKYEEVGGAFRADWIERFVKVVFPGALPFIFAGLRLAVGRGLVGLVVGDLFGSTAGLGHMILRSAQLFDTPGVFVATIVLAMLGVILSAVLGAIQRVVVQWQRVET